MMLPSNAWLLPLMIAAQEQGYHTLPVEGDILAQPNPFYVEIYKTKSHVYSEPYNVPVASTHHPVDSYFPENHQTNVPPSLLETRPVVVADPLQPTANLANSLPLDYYRSPAEVSGFGNYYNEREIEGKPSSYSDLQPQTFPKLTDTFLDATPQVPKPKKKSKYPKKYTTSGKKAQKIKAIQPIENNDDFPLNTDKLKRRIPLTFNSDEYTNNYEQAAEFKNPFSSEINSFGDNLENQQPFGSQGQGERMEFQMFGMNGPNSYKFGYDTGRGPNRHFRYEERDNDGKIRGHYGYMDQEGKMSMIKYEADPYTGFHAGPYELPNEYHAF